MKRMNEGGAILFAFITGVLIGIAEPPWDWQTYVLVVVFLTWFVLRITKTES